MKERPELARAGEGKGKLKKKGKRARCREKELDTKEPQTSRNWQRAF